MDRPRRGRPLKALTIWQPWASLIIAEAKPFEFRGWPAPHWLVGQELVIHAGQRLLKGDEIVELMRRLENPRTAWTTGLFADKALPILQAALNQSRRKPGRSAGLFDPVQELDLPLKAGLGTVTVGEPQSAIAAARDKFEHVIVNDSDRSAHANYAWPMLDVKPFASPMPCPGAQGLWNWPTAEGMAGI